MFRAKCIICPALLAALTIGLGSAGCKMKPFPRMSLEEAAKAGDVEQIDANLYGGAKVNAANAEGVTALHLAALGGHKEAVVFLVEKGADIKARTSGRGTPLDFAIGGGNKEIVEYLLSKGAEVDAGDSLGRTPVHLAVKKGDLEILRLILSKGADINVRASDKSTPLYLAITTENLAVARFLLDNGADVNGRGADGATPLHVAVERGDIEAARLLLDAGADVNAVDDLALSALFIAAAGGRGKFGNKALPTEPPAAEAWNFVPWANALSYDSRGLVELLLSHGADINFRVKYGITALHVAALRGDRKIIEMLLAKKADVNARDSRNFTPLHYAVSNTSPEAAEALIAGGADVNAYGDGYGTPLLLAASGAVETVDVLLAKGAKAAVVDRISGATPLHHVMNRDTALALIHAGVPVSAVDNFGQTALHKAAAASNLPVARVLLDNGADVNVRDREGLTPLALANGELRPDLVKLLESRGAHK